MSPRRLPASAPDRFVLLEGSAAVAPHEPPRPMVTEMVARVIETKRVAGTMEARSVQAEGLPPPGIVVSRPAEQTARILGSGLEVWEVYKAFLEMGRDEERLRRAFHWLTEEQLHAALRYAAEHEAAILARIRADYARLPEELRPVV